MLVQLSNESLGIGEQLTERELLDRSFSQVSTPRAVRYASSPLDTTNMRQVKTLFRAR
jgi:hypothetical protein